MPVFLATTQDDYFLSYSLWTWRMDGFLQLYSSTLYLRRYTPLQSSLPQFIPLFFVKLVFLYTQWFSFLFCSVSLFVCIYPEPQCANNRTAAEARLVTQKDYLIHLTERISAYTSFTALSGLYFPRLLMTILSSHSKGSKFVFLGKLRAMFNSWCTGSP